MAQVCLSLHYTKEPYELPKPQDVKSSFRESLSVVMGDIGGGSYVWDILPDGVTSTENSRVFLVKVTMRDRPDSRSIGKFCAAASMTKQIANERVVVRAVDR